MKSIYGFSRSCVNTCFYWSEINALLDCGPYASFYGTEASHIFISHVHSDHISGIINLLYIKFCRNHNEEMFIYGPDEVCSYIEGLINLSKEYNIFHTIPNFNLIPLTEEKQIKIVNNIYCYPIKTFHRCTSMGFSFIKGRDVILTYTSDTNSDILFHPFITETKNLIIESTYLEEENIEKSRQRGHISLPELKKLGENFKGEKIYITHFRDSYREQDIYNAIKQLKFSFLFEPIGLTV